MQIINYAKFKIFKFLFINQISKISLFQNNKSFKNYNFLKVYIFKNFNLKT